MDGDKESWLLEERRELVRASISCSLEFSYSTLKWILTSTLTLNSAALFASFSSVKFANQLLKLPAWFFVGGMAFALFGALTSLVGFADLSGNMADSLWRGEGIDDEAMDKFNPGANRFLLFGAALSGLAIAAFLSGVILSGIEMNMQNAATSGIPR